MTSLARGFRVVWDTEKRKEMVEVERTYVTLTMPMAEVAAFERALVRAAATAAKAGDTLDEARFTAILEAMKNRGVEIAVPT